MGSAFKRVYGYYVKRPLQRFNVDKRAEKLVEQQITVPKAAPRHANTDQLFKEITQSLFISLKSFFVSNHLLNVCFLSDFCAENPHFRKELDEKREDLLKRLTSVKVVSKDRDISEQELKEMEEIRKRVRSRLPQSRHRVDIPMHAYVEPSHVPIGRISLIRALDLIGKHAKRPEEYDSQTIAKQHHLDEEEVKNVLDYFKPFYKENISDPVTDTEKVLGIPKEHFDSIISYLKPKSQLSSEQISASSDHNSDESQTKIKIENRDK